MCDWKFNREREGGGGEGGRKAAGEGREERVSERKEQCKSSERGASLLELKRTGTLTAECGFVGWCWDRGWVGSGVGGQLSRNILCINQEKGGRGHVQRAVINKRYRLATLLLHPDFIRGGSESLSCSSSESCSLYSHTCMRM